MMNSPVRPASKSPRRQRAGDAGQAFIEFAFIMLMLSVMVFSLIDFGRLIYEHEVVVNLSREGSNLASRGTGLTNTVQAIETDSALNLSDSNGLIIVSTVDFNTNGTFFVNQQLTQGLLPETSKIGVGSGSNVTAHVPTVLLGPPPVPSTNRTLYCTEVYHKFIPITPVGKLLALTLPTEEYDAAYFLGYSDNSL